MKPNTFLKQIARYAEDLNQTVHEMDDKNQLLTSTKAQMMKFAADLKTTHAALETSHKELKNAYIDTIHRLALAAEFKDPETGSHILRMSYYCALLSQNLGLPCQKVEDIFFAAPMHDIGKIGIPDRILLKRGKLTREEFDQIKNHTLIGEKILSNSSSKILQVAQSIALNHHEKWDGTGYPRGIATESIPIAGRIAALADAFDALTTRRPYKKPYSVKMATGIIINERGSQFDPSLVDIFIARVDDFVGVMNRIGMNAPDDENPIILSERDRKLQPVQLATGD